MAADADRGENLVIHVTLGFLLGLLCGMALMVAGSYSGPPLPSPTPTPTPCAMYETSWCVP